jgi:hypothetical protein
MPYFQLGCALNAVLSRWKNESMSLPLHRGQINPGASMTYRGSTWGGRDKVDEANRSLMEQENDRKWVLA